MGITAFHSDTENAADGDFLQVAHLWLAKHHPEVMDEAIISAYEAVIDASAEEPVPDFGHEEVANYFGRCAMDAAFADHVAPGSKGTLIDLIIQADQQQAFLTPAQRLYAQRFARAPFRLHQITRVNPGRSITLVDVVNTQAPPVTVEESVLSLSCDNGMLLGARVIDLATHKVLAPGILPVPVPAMSPIVDAVENLVGKYASRKGGTLTTVIGPVLASALLGKIPLRVIDRASGEPMCMVEDRYEILDRQALVQSMGQQPAVERTSEFGWHRISQGSSSTTGAQKKEQLLCSISEDSDNAGTLVVFYTTRKAAAMGKDWFAAVAGKSVRHRSMTETDPEQLRAKERANPSTNRSSWLGEAAYIPSELKTQIIQQTYEEQYKHWATSPLPMLDNMTPLQACETRAGQERVRGIINLYVSGEADFAARDQRKPASFKFLWSQVKLKP